MSHHLQVEISKINSNGILFYKIPFFFSLNTMNFFKRRRILKNLNYLEATPIRKCDFNKNEEGIITLIVPKFKNERFNKWFFHHRRRYFRISLDEVGSVVWQQIDGHTRVLDICNKSVDILGDKIQPVEQRVTKFLTTLYEARYISFVEIEQ